MTVNDFVKNYKSTNNKEQFWKKHITTTYVPVIKKQTYARSIVKGCNYTKVGDKQIFQSRTFNTYLLFTMRLINLYTDIDIVVDDNDGNVFANQYDELNKNGLIEGIMSAIPESEYKEFKTILQMETDDLYQNEYSVPALLYSIKESLSMSSEVFGQVLDNVDFSTLNKPQDNVVDIASK